jgi:hypothetical protein
VIVLEVELLGSIVKSLGDWLYCFVGQATGTMAWGVGLLTCEYLCIIIYILHRALIRCILDEL